MKSTGSVEINRNIDDVFRLTNEHVPKWSLVVVDEEIIHQADGVGTTFRTVTEDRGQQMEFEGIVTQYDPPHSSTVELTGNQFDIEAHYRFEELSTNRTRVTQQSVVHGKGFFKLFFFCFGWAFRKSSCDAAQQELESLKRFCENYNF